MNNSKTIGFALLILCLLAIALVPIGSGEQPTPAPKAKSDGTTDASPAITYGKARQVGKLNSPSVRESSGLGSSRSSIPFLWTHNDSGNQPQLHAFDFTGKHLASLTIDGAKCIDWEDMAAIKWKNAPYILLGDMGDNRAMRDECQLYLIPDTARTGDSFANKLSVERKIRFVYEDGPHDCEGLGYDEATNSILLISKSWGAFCDVYHFKMPAKDDDSVQIAKPIARLKLAGFTSFDIAPDSSRAIGVTYGNAYEFTRLTDETWADAFRRAPREIPLPPRKQGEGVCYGADGKTIYTTSEGFQSPLIQVAPK